MAALQVSYYLASGEAKGKIDLPEALSNAPVSRRVLHETIRVLQGNQRQGTSATKTRGLVSGGGRKPWKQKGTGNARAGSIRSPLWRKGGIIFGPQPRSYYVDLGDTKKRAALQTAVIEKVRDARLSVIESLSLKEAKTSAADKIFKKTGITGRVLVVVDQKESNLNRGLRNLAGIELLDVKEVNAWHLTAAPTVLITQSALQALLHRLPQG